MKIIFIDDNSNVLELNDQEVREACMYEYSITDYFVFCEICESIVLRSNTKIIDGVNTCNSCHPF